MKRKLQRVTVTYEYTNGFEGIRSFPTWEKAMVWINNEGDRILDYTVYFNELE